MEKEICCNWNDMVNRCEGLVTRCNGCEPLDGSQCNFYKTKKQKKQDDQSTIKRLESIDKLFLKDAHTEAYLRKTKYNYRPDKKENTDE